jgi:hypothetical protein
MAALAAPAEAARGAAVAAPAEAAKGATVAMAPAKLTPGGVTATAV